MDIEKLLELADIIERGANGLDLDMTTWHSKNDCGTSACIAGHAIWVWGDVPLAEVRQPDVPRVASQILDLSRGQADELFLGNLCATAEEAVEALRRMARGEHAWPR